MAGREGEDCEGGRMIYSNALNDGCVCQGCGSLYIGDLLVPDTVWERIKPAGKPTGAGLLCASCIMAAIRNLGIWTAARAYGVDDAGLVRS